jgi:hypothetical protein
MTFHDLGVNATTRCWRNFSVSLRKPFRNITVTADKYGTKEEHIYAAYGVMMSVCPSMRSYCPLFGSSEILGRFSWKLAPTYRSPFRLVIVWSHVGTTLALVIEIWRLIPLISKPAVRDPDPRSSTPHLHNSFLWNPSECCTQIVFVEVSYPTFLPIYRLPAVLKESELLGFWTLSSVRYSKK